MNVILYALFLGAVCLAAVQEERQRKEKCQGEGEVESTSTVNNDMPVEKVLEAELAVEPNTDTYVDTPVRNAQPVRKHENVLSTENKNWLRRN